VCLAEHANETVSKEELIRTVWGDAFVTDDVLTRCISELRKALDDDSKQPRVIETIPKRGYRILLEVERQSANLAKIHVSLGQHEQAIRYLEMEVEQGGGYWLKVEPWWDPLRAEPRFQALLRKMNFPT
jgi:DNA-binding winged helix-turn-helix (wHTH) protein